MNLRELSKPYLTFITLIWLFLVLHEYKNGVDWNFVYGLTNKFQDRDNLGGARHYKRKIRIGFPVFLLPTPCKA